MKERPDANDTLRAEGVEGVRERHDRARKFEGNDGGNGHETGGPLIEMPVLKLDDWLKRDLMEPDFLLGHLLSTTSRAIINAPTGIGKTMFGMAMFMRMSAATGFLRWQSVRPARSLLIDGEMSRRLLKQRLADEAARLGYARAFARRC
jgi:hypothetical protein